VEFAKGQDEQIASFPLEFRKGLMKARDQQYPQLDLSFEPKIEKLKR
jgi:hypothetical protein